MTIHSFVLINYLAKESEKAKLLFRIAVLKRELSY